MDLPLWDEKHHGTSGDLASHWLTGFLAIITQTPKYLIMSATYLGIPSTSSKVVMENGTLFSPGIKVRLGSVPSLIWPSRPRHGDCSHHGSSNDGRIWPTPSTAAGLSVVLGSACRLPSWSPPTLILCPWLAGFCSTLYLPR